MAAILKMLVVLSAICGIAGFALSYLKMITAPTIEEQVLAYVQGPALQRVFVGIDNAPVAERRKFALSDGRPVTVFPARKGGKLVGVALENTGKGYGGDVGVMVGIDPARDVLVGIGITTMKETPGIGTLVGEPAFTRQFPGKPLEIGLKSQGGDIDAVSGATISSSGAATAVANAAKAYKELKPEILKAWPQ